MKLSEYIKKQKPVDISRTLGKRQDNSTADKNRLINKAITIENFFEKIGKPLNVE
jgi:hypothetical protein